MFLRSLTIACLALAFALPAPRPAQADAGDFVGGALVGGVVGYAIGKDQQKKKTQATTTTRTYRSGIPSTTQGAQTQTALNYFGYNAGVVDGQVGRGTRTAIERYQASMGYPVNGHSFQPYQYDFLMQAYYWATSGGQASTGMSGQPLLMAYRQQMQTGTALAATPQPQAPAPAPEAATASTGSLPSLFSGGSTGPSLANRCNAVMLQTSSNGGYTTLANMTDPNFTLSEQFCLARSYAIARGEEQMQQVQGLSAEQISAQCQAFGEMLAPQVDAVSLNAPPNAEAQMRSFALGTGLSPADLAATSRVCLAVGYSQDNMDAAIGSALMLVAMGEPAYGELIGHHLREGFGVAQRTDLAKQWYNTSLSALDSGSQAAFVPSQTERPQLLRAAMGGL